jgi:hypothetical protein
LRRTAARSRRDMGRDLATRHGAGSLNTSGS